LKNNNEDMVGQIAKQNGRLTGALRPTSFAQMLRTSQSPKTLSEILNLG